ncbi:MAG TPA: aminotransferase class I/II-fold pyridoxal phosphate-dependent enzyme [Chloroflexaceae bacterium]|nr:aminotransferase class I/II-fold pyridoxal phosphate-dependent enzyme [Chloroflexaceae bacterium]
MPHWLRLRRPERDTVLYPEISYPSYAMGAQLAGARAVPVPVDVRGLLQLDAIPAGEADRALVLWVNSPSNPTGALDDLDAAARWGRAHGVPVLSIGPGAPSPECAAGHQQVCDRQFQPGFTHWGSFAEYVAIDRADLNLVRLPDELDYLTAASLGCRFATSFRAVVDQGRVTAGQWVAVHGCGGVGLSAVIIAAALGAQVVAIDITEEKLAFARSLGATATLNGATTDDLPAAVRELTGGGAHVSLDALGSPTTCFSSVACLRKRGRHIQVGLLLAEQSRPPIPMDLVVGRELEILGSHGMQAHRYGAMLELIRSGKARPDLMVGRTIALDEAPAALADLDTFRGVGVTLIDRFAA